MKNINWPAFILFSVAILYGVWLGVQVNNQSSIRIHAE